ncbi:MAG: M28 family peptidase [Acidobacteria bacterium]|nr:M28 family peptidase [Acidobacteriota bacterium]
MKRILAMTAVVLFSSTAAIAADAPEAMLPERAMAAADTIDEALLRGHIRFLSSDLLEGRGPSTLGDQLTQLYLATEMESLGLEPAGPDGSWYQPFDIVGVNTRMPEEWTFSSGGKSVSLDSSEEFMISSGVQKPKLSLNGADLVFVGYGIQAPEYGWDDFKGHDLKGKVVVMLNNDPDWSPDLFAGETRLYYGRWTYKYESAARQGAAGAIIIHTTPSAGYPWQVVETSWAGEQFQLPAGDEPRTPVQAWVTEDAAREILSLSGHDLDQLTKQARSKDFRPVPLGVTTSVEASNEVAKVRTANVAGILRGSDPVLNQEVVVYTAHHDHLGKAEGDDEDLIYNGALDNASGTAQVLGIARAFASLPERPQRSVMFLFVAAEEQGLLGSAFYAAHPTFLPGRMAANINLDGGNIWGATRDLTFIGLGKSTMDDYVLAFAEMQGRTVKPDQFPDRGFFYRSDQFNFAKLGVPAVFTDTGTDFVGRPEGWGKEQIEKWEAVNYHQASDELEDWWSFDGMIQDAQLSFFVGAAVAEADEMPVWNPGDEFEAARKEALAEAGRLMNQKD